MGLFDVFAHKPKSYHWSESQGRMVECANTPCRLHSSDVVCSNLDEAEAAHRNIVEAAERRAREEAARTNEHGYNVEWLKTLDPDPKRADRMASNWMNQKIIVWTPMRICGRHYMISTNGLAGACRRCHGSGVDPERKLKSGKATECIYCSGKGYSTMYGGPAHEAVTSMEPMNDEERRFQDFVRSHGKEFDRYVRMAGVSGSYMSDPALDQTYGKWRGNDLGKMMAYKPDEALNLMRSLYDKYNDAEREWKSMVAEEAVPDYGSMNMDGPVKAKYPVGGEPTCFGRIVETHDYKDRKTGRDMTAYVIYSDGRYDNAPGDGDDPDHWVAVVFDNAGHIVGDDVKVTGRVTGLDVDGKGMVRETMIPTKMHVTSILG